MTSLKTPSLTLAFHVRLDFGDGPRIRFEPSFRGGTRGFVAVLGGEVRGPRLQGRVIPQSGGDWPRMWASGLVEFEAHYMMEAADGTPIYIHNRGLAYSNPDVLRRIEAGEAVDPGETYCHITPRFEAPEGPHGWLTRTVFLGTAERRGASTFFDYYAVG